MKPLAFIVTMALLAGCSDAPTGAAAGSPDFAPGVGTYALSAVDGQSLPAALPGQLTLVNDTCTFYVTGGSLVISPGHRYALAVSVRETCTSGSQREWTRSDAGSFAAAMAGAVVFTQDATSDWQMPILSAQAGSGPGTLVAAMSFAPRVTFVLR